MLCITDVIVKYLHICVQKKRIKIADNIVFERCSDGREQENTNIDDAWSIRILASLTL